MIISMFSRMASRLAAAGVLLWMLAGAAPAWAEAGQWFDEDEVVTTNEESTSDAHARAGETTASPESVATPARVAKPARLDSRDADPRALETFRPALEPFGQWVEDSRYGLVWVPGRTYVGERFTPYVTAGRWELDDSGDWVWVSELPFGPVVFHYGRWVWIPPTGWAWIPGYEYRGAWVSWRLSSGPYGYVGWAPLPPSYIWLNGRATVIVHGYPERYYYVPHRQVLRRDLHRHVVRDRARLARLRARTVRVPAAPRAVVIDDRSALRSPRPRSSLTVPRRTWPEARSVIPNERARVTAPVHRVAPAPTPRFRSSTPTGRWNRPEAERRVRPSVTPRTDVRQPSRSRTRVPARVRKPASPSRR